MELPYFAYISSQIFWTIVFLILNILINYLVIYRLSNEYQSQDKKAMSNLLSDINKITNLISNKTKTVNVLRQKYANELNEQSEEYFKQTKIAFEIDVQAIEHQYQNTVEDIESKVSRWNDKFTQFCNLSEVR